MFENFTAYLKEVLGDDYTLNEEKENMDKKEEEELETEDE